MSSILTISLTICLILHLREYTLECGQANIFDHHQFTMSLTCTLTFALSRFPGTVCTRTRTRRLSTCWRRCSPSTHITGIYLVVKILQIIKISEKRHYYISDLISRKYTYISRVCNDCKLVQDPGGGRTGPPIPGAVLRSSWWTRSWGAFQVRHVFDSFQEVCYVFIQLSISFLISGALILSAQWTSIWWAS